MFFWDPYNSNTGVVNVAPEVSEMVLIAIHSFTCSPASPAPFIEEAVFAPGEGDGTPLQYSCLENPMDGGAW